MPKEEFRDADPDLPPARVLLSDLAKAGARTAGELMTVPAVTVRPDETIARAARTMAHHQVKRLPVVDGNGVLKGIVSRSDLLKVFLRDDLDIAGEVRREVVARLFPAPLEPVRVDVRDGVVTLTGRVPDTALVPVAVRLTRAVEGVVDVECALAGPRRHVDLDADLPDPDRPGTQESDADVRGSAAPVVETPAPDRARPHPGAPGPDQESAPETAAGTASEAAAETHEAHTGPKGSGGPVNAPDRPLLRRTGT